MEKKLTTEETIIANGLVTRYWGVDRNFGYGCSECCNRDCCDEGCTAKYYRPDCPHCKGRGWIPESEATKGIAIEQPSTPKTNTND